MSVPPDSFSEREASKRWCPFARTFFAGDYLCGSQGQEVTNFDAPTASFTRCIGSQCMAWRWHGALTGYCGLAGKPLGPHAPLDTGTQAMQHNKPRYELTEAFKLLSMSRAQGYNRIRQGALRVQKDGTRSYISATELDRYVLECDRVT